MAVPLHCVLPLPTKSAIIFEAVYVATEEGAHHTTAGIARRILEIRIHLNALCEFPGLYFDVAGLHSFHVVLSGYECHATGTNRVFVPVSINPGVHDTSEEIVHNGG